MKRKKGFTLIELLAVIVILAIIALITVPTVIKIINNAKKGAAEDSTYGAVEAAKLYWASHATFDNENESEDVTFTCGNDGCKYNDDILDISGDKPTSGTITISNGNVTASNLVFGNFTCSLSNDIVTCGSDSIPEPSNPQQPVAYYEFGEPTTSSTTDYTTLGKTVFVKLEGEQKSVCIVRNGELSCLKNNNYSEYSTSLLTTGFAGMSFIDDGPSVWCDDGTFNCHVYPDGEVDCYVNSTGAYCDVSAHGDVDCSFGPGLPL